MGYKPLPGEYVKTSKGKVVYQKKKHRFGINDARRVVLSLGDEELSKINLINYLHLLVAVLNRLAYFLLQFLYQDKIPTNIFQEFRRQLITLCIDIFKYFPGLVWDTVRKRLEEETDGSE